MPDRLDSFIDDAFLKQLEKLKIVSRKSTRNPRRGVLSVGKRPRYDPSGYYSWCGHGDKSVRRISLP